MAVIQFSKVKEMIDKKQTPVILDLGKFIHSDLNGMNMPFLVKSFKEQLEIKTKIKFEVEGLELKYVQLRKAPKAIREVYAKAVAEGRKDVPTYVQYADAVKDAQKLETKKFDERLLNVVIHFNMDYIIDEEGKTTLWEDAGLKKGDYKGLVELFSQVLQEDHLDTFETLIEALKEGIVEEGVLVMRLQLHKLRQSILKIEDEEERKVAWENLNNSLREMFVAGNTEDEETSPTTEEK